MHGETVKFYRNEFRGHLVIQVQGGGHSTLVTPDGVSPILTTDTTYYGPGYLLSYMLGMGESIFIIAHTNGRRRRHQGVARTAREVAKCGCN